jgi:hypothetical protein
VKKQELEEITQKKSKNWKIFKICKKTVIKFVSF